MTSMYIDFPKKYCPNVTSLCWIPQADSIIHEHIIPDLPQCDTIEKYSCMLLTIRSKVYTINEKCMKSCKAKTYKISSSRNTVDTFSAVSKNICKIEIYRFSINSSILEREDMENLCGSIIPKLH